MALHSVTEAAKLAGVTRRTIYRYIKQGKLSAAVSDSDTTVIETSELLRVFGALSQPEPEKVSTGSHDKPATDVTVLLEEIRDMKSEIESLKQTQLLMLEDLKAREKLDSERHEQIELIGQLQRERDALSAALETERRQSAALEAEKGKGFWSRIFKKG